MRKVKFYGYLKRYGDSFDLEVETAAEAIRALTSQISGLKEAFYQGKFKVKVGNRFIQNDKLENIRNVSDGDISIIPVVRGAGGKGGLGQILVGVVLIAAAYFTGGASMTMMGAMGSTMGMMGAAMILGGVAQMLTKPPKLDTKEARENRVNPAFSNLENMQPFNRPVPLIYGEPMSSGIMISRGIETYTPV